MAKMTQNTPVGYLNEKMQDDNIEITAMWN